MKLRRLWIRMAALLMIPGVSAVPALAEPGTGRADAAGASVHRLSDLAVFQEVVGLGPADGDAGILTRGNEQPEIVYIGSMSRFQSTSDAGK